MNYKIDPYKIDVKQYNNSLAVYIRDKTMIKKLGTSRFFVPPLIIDTPFYIECILKYGFKEGKIVFYKNAKVGEGFTHWKACNRRFKKYSKIN